MPTLLSVFGVQPLRIGGTETFARELSRQLGDQGWESVLCFLSEPTADVRRFLDLPNTSFAVLPNSTNGNLKAAQNLSRIMRRVRPEILHLHYTGFISVYPWMARLRSVEKVFFTDHHSRPAGYVPTRAPAWKRSATRILNAPLTNVISVSNYGHQCMTSFDLLPRERFQMVYNGVDRSRVNVDASRAQAFRRRYSIPEDRAIVTQVSWIIPEKGIADFLQTARLVTAKNRNVQFVLVGDGAYREEYMKAAASIGLEDRLTWTGMIEDPFGAGVYDAADVVCQFSRWEEVFGWMIAEAMAHGKPVVATRVGGIPELITDGVSGYLVDRGDTEAMSERLLTLLGNAELGKQMGRAGCEKVSNSFDLQTNVAQLVELYGVRQQVPLKVNRSDRSHRTSQDQKESDLLRNLIA